MPAKQKSTSTVSCVIKRAEQGSEALPQPLRLAKANGYNRTCGQQHRNRALKLLRATCVLPAVLDELVNCCQVACEGNTLASKHST